MLLSFSNASCIVDDAAFRSTSRHVPTSLSVYVGEYFGESVALILLATELRQSWSLTTGTMTDIKPKYTLGLTHDMTEVICRG